MNSNSVFSVSLSSVCLLWVVTIAHAQTCDRTLTATYDFNNQSAIIGSVVTFINSAPTCTWTINTENTTYTGQLQTAFGDAKFTVMISFRYVNLTKHATCDETNSIVVYDGDTSGLILGLVCRNLSSTFQSTGNTLTVQYPSTEVSAADAFTVTYKQLRPLSCDEPSVHAVSSNEYSVLSPMYPTGMPKFPLDCDWFFFPRLSTERVRVTIETTSTLCSNVTVTVQDSFGGTSSQRWCPGEENNFQSWGSIFRLKLKIAEGVSVRVKYRLLEASPCNVVMNATTEEQFLTTPNYPAPYPSFTECRWTIWNRESDQNTIRLEIVDMDMEETEGCRTDSLKVQLGTYSDDPVIGTTCGTDPTSYYAYQRVAQVIFRSVRASNTRKGVRLKYYLGQAEPCGGNLTASSSVQSILSPGFPHAYPSSFKCVWKISAENPDNFLKAEFVTNDIFSAFSSCFGGDAVKLYDGDSSNAYQLGEVCGKSPNPSFQGLDNTMTVVFRTDSLPDEGGFNMTYVETEVPLVSRRTLTSRLKAATLTSPKYPDGEVKNINSTWVIESQLSEYKTRMTFTEVDFGDPAECSDNYVKVFYGDTSSPLSSTLCGNETGVYISRGKSITVVMKTDSISARRGFKADYHMLYSTDFAGCMGEPEVVSAYSSFSKTTNIPDYPNTYPNLAECTYIIEAFSDNYFLRLDIVDIDFVKSNNCSGDYMEFYDGNTTAAASLGRLCDKPTKEIVSTGPYVLVRFISDANLGAKGAQIKFQAEYIDRGDKTNYLWVIILVSVLGGLVIVAFVVYHVIKKRKRSGSAPI